MEPCRTPFCPVALTTEPETPLPDTPPFQPPDTIKSANTQLEPIPLPVATNNICTMTQPDDTPPIMLCSAIEFWRYARAADTTTYLCIFKQQDDTPPPQNRDDFAEYVRGYALRHFPQLFPDELPRQLPPSDRIQHPIDLTVSHKIPPRKLYRQSADELAETKRRIHEYLQAGHIRPSNSSFGAPVLLVKKKDSSMRMCIDYRRLNDITIKNNFPLPRIDDLHDRLGNARFFTKLDLHSGYHQIPIRPGDEHKTAFTSRYGTYEFMVMPFGLTNAPATFQTAMTILFTEWLDDFVIVYLDDILIYSQSQSDHIQHARQVMQKLLDHQWVCKLKKCDFATKSVEYLGHIVSDGRIAIDPDKMKAVTDWPVPFKNLHEVQSFLGLVGYYRKFIPRFSHTARHLYDLTRKNVEFKWTDKHSEAVNQLKKAVHLARLLGNI